MADEIPNGLSANLVKVGERLRRLRKERGWKLEDLAERTNLSRAYLSRLENGERQPSLTALFHVAQAYGVAFSSLFESEPDLESGVIVRAAQAPVRRGNGLFYANLSRGSWAFNLHPIRIVVPAEREEGEVYQHEGEQWLYVVSGSLGLGIGDEEFILESGDAAHFSADNPHRLTALGGRDAEIILVACAVPYLLLKSYL
ncbi:MAG: XRE family transcriptional regulator [Actinobacteria bacterium]|nr:XRE family transcriptional regulator [Actinomycetota bacterium]